MSFAQHFLAEVQEIARRLDAEAIETLARSLAAVRDRGGRLFLLGVGGSAANASHAVNDFRKIASIETYAPTDNVSELTARTNDEGWASVFAGWLKVSRLGSKDGVLVFSVGGGDLQRQVSPNLVAALDYAKTAGAMILGIVGRDGGYTARLADACVVIPTVNPVHVTPHSEAFQAVVWHLLVSHPALKQNQTRWEAAAGPRARAVFLDRDGVLNRVVLREGKPYPPPGPEQVELMPGAEESLARLKQDRFLLLVVSNQPDVARGQQQRETVEQIHSSLKARLPVDDFFVCYHDDADHCECRKPRPGLLLRAASRYEVDLRGSYMVGDRWRDVEAGAAAGCRTVWIDRGYSEPGPATRPDARVSSLAEAVEWILQDSGRAG